MKRIITDIKIRAAMWYLTVKIWYWQLYIKYWTWRRDRLDRKIRVDESRRFMFDGENDE